MKLIIASLYGVFTTVLTIVIAFTIIWRLTEWPISRSNISFGLTTGLVVGVVFAAVAVLLKLNGASDGRLIAVIVIGQTLFAAIFYYILASWAAV